MERLYRLVFMGLFVIGFVGAAAGSHQAGLDGGGESPFMSLIKDVQLVQEAHDINAGRWSLDASGSNDASLDQIEAHFKRN